MSAPGGSIDIGNASPTVSIIMPTYQRLTYLREAVDSALAQTWTDIELIVSDNAMSDELQQIVESYGDDRIRYRTNGSNIGPMRNALAAYKSARGEFVTTLHDDDVYEPNFLERLVPPLQADPTLSLAFSDHFIIGSDSVIDLPRTESNTRLWRRDRLRRGVYRPYASIGIIDRAIPAAMSTVFRKSAIDWDDFPAEMDPNYDTWLAYLASRDGSGAYYDSDRLTRYRVHDASMTSGTSTGPRYDRPLVYCYQRFLDDPRLADIRDGLRREAAQFNCGYGLALLEQGNRRAARRELITAVRRGSPMRAMAGLALSVSPVPPKSVLARVRRLRPHSAAVR